MIPIRTTVGVIEAPGMVLGLIAANLSVFLYLTALPPESLAQFIFEHALVPIRFTQPKLEHELGFGSVNVLALFTHTFLHSGWLHLIVNMWALWIFGGAVEAYFGKLRFLLFYLSCGVLASLVHLAFNVDSSVPTLGASGAIAGVLGSYTLLYPRARVLLMVPRGLFPLAFEVPAVTYTALWFGFQAIQLTTERLGVEQPAGIAWWAHIGGLAAGLVLTKWARVSQHGPRQIGSRWAGESQFGDLPPSRQSTRVADVPSLRARTQAAFLTHLATLKSDLAGALTPIESRDPPKGQGVSRSTASRVATLAAIATHEYNPPSSSKDREDSSGADSGIKSLLLSCMDARLLSRYSQYMAKRGLTDQYDHVVLAGASLGAVTERYPAWRKTFFEHIEAAIQLHNIEQVLVMDHRDCSAYETILRANLEENSAAETVAHTAHLTKLRHAIRARYPQLEVELLLMSMDGSVESIY